MEKKRHQGRFIQSAAHFKELPKQNKPEFGLLGRSNVGKSSFINHVLENSSLARISRRPGKTSLANIYEIDDDHVWVDLPGYGYAKTSQTEKKRWSRLIQEYCTKRQNLNGVLWLTDIRHPGLAIDREAFDWLHGLGIPIFPVLTKGDKLTPAKQKQQVHQCQRLYNFATMPVVYTTYQHRSREQFWEHFDSWRNG